MNLVYKRLFNRSAQVAIFELPKDEAALEHAIRLSQKEQSRLSTITNKEKRIEFIAQRFAIQHHVTQVGQISHNDLGKPDLGCHGRVSISHSHGYLAFLTSKEHEVGVDLQVLTPKMERIKKRFLSEEEWSRPAVNDLRTLHIYWCAKEALFKYYALGNVDFRTELHIEPFEAMSEGIMHGLIKKEKEERVRLRYKSIGDCILVYTDSVLLQ